MFVARWRSTIGNGKTDLCPGSGKGESRHHRPLRTSRRRNRTTQRLCLASHIAFAIITCNLLQNKYCKIRLRYSREGASQSLQNICQKLDQKLEKTQARPPADSFRPTAVEVPAPPRRGPPESGSQGSRRELLCPIDGPTVCCRSENHDDVFVPRGDRVAQDEV